MQFVKSRIGANLIGSFKVFIWLLPLLLLGGMLGYVLIEGYSWLDAFFMVIITISTVGYGEVNELSQAGKIYSAILIICNIGVFSYLVSVFSYYIIQGEYFKKIYIGKMKKNVSKLRNHVIICGYGKYGNEIVDHFLKHHIPFVVLEKNKETVDEVMEERTEILILHADATNDDQLILAGIGNASTLISALSEDMDNLYVVITARQLNEKLRIISRASDQKAVKKLEKAGANHVIMPELIGGFYMATLVSKPGATTFFSYIADEISHDIDFEEVFIEDFSKQNQKLWIKDIQIREESGANIIGLKGLNGEYIVNPSDMTPLSHGTSIIVLGSSEQLDKMRTYIKTLA